MKNLQQIFSKAVSPLIGVAVLFAGAPAFAIVNDTYSIDEDSVLNVAAPGVLLNDILPLGSEPITTTVTAVNVTPSTAPGTANARTFPGNVGGAGRPLVMNANGSFTYDPRGVFDFLAAGESVVDVVPEAAGPTTRYINSASGAIGTVTITVTGVNDAPTDMALSSNVVNENPGPNTVVGALSTTDVDTSDTHSYSLVGGTGDVLNDSFKIVGSNLVTKGNSLDADQSTPRTVRIRTSDGNGGSFDKVFTLSVTPVAATPNVSSTATLTPNEDTAVNLGLSASLNDATDETLSVVISGLPTGATLTDGFNVSSAASTNVSSWNLANITVTPKSHDDSDFTLTVTATATEAVNANAAQATSTTNVNVVAIADTPGLTVTGAVSGNEDTAIGLTINGSLVDTDGSETLTYRVSGVPTGASLNNGTDAGGGVWNLAAGDVAGLTITPPLHNAAAFAISVTATATETNGGSAASSAASVINVTVTPVADAPTLTITGSVSGNEDTAIALTIAASLVDTDASEILNGFQITGVPTGATLSQGTNAGSGVWNLTPGQVAGLTLTPALHDDADFSLSVTATSRETSNGDTATSATGSIAVTVTAVADAPTLSVTGAVTGNEDAAIPLTISAALVDNDGSESVTSYQLTGVPTGASLSSGADGGGGVWNVAAADISSLTITPKLHDAAAFSLSVTATTTETTGGDTATSGPSVINVTVTPVADAPLLTVSNASGNEDAAIALTISAALVDTDGSETIDSYQVTGVPTGATLNQGTDAGAGVWNLTAVQVTGLTITPKLHDDSDFNLSVTATTRETVNSVTATSAAGTIAVTVTAVADAPTVSVTATASGNEDTAIALTIAGGLIDTDGSETLSFRISNVPTGASLNNGTDAGGGVWNVTAAGAAGLTLTPKLHDDSDFTLTVASVATESANAAEALTSATIAITVVAVVDTPNFSAPASISGSEDIAITVGVTSSLVDTDGSETLTIQVAGVPTGATLNNGTDAGGGVWNLVAADLSGLTITNKLHDDSDFSIGVTVTATEARDSSSVTLATATIAVTVAAVADVPTITVTSSVTRDEDSGAVPLTIAGDLVDTDGSESMTYQISGVLDSATLSAGVNQGGGLWTLTEAQAESGLTLTMDTHVAENFLLVVNALATETRDSSTQLSLPGQISVLITPKADQPTLSVNALATGNEDAAIPLTISGELVDIDGSETLTMVMTGQPASSTFSAGTDLGGGSWGVDVADLSGLTISAAADNNDDFTLTVTANARETGNGDTASKSDTILVQIQPVNDAPSLAPFTFAVDENSPNGTIVGTVTATDVEPVGVESAQTYTYEITGSAFSIDNGGVIRVADVTQLDAETTPQFTPTVTARDSGLPSLDASATVTINLNGLDDNTPVAVDDDVSVDEQATLNFSVVANDTDEDVPAQTLFVSEVNGDVGLVGVPVDILTDGLVVGSLTVNGDGSATFVTTTVVTVEKFTGSATYRVTDGDSPSLNEGTINITINPINDNQPSLSVAGQTAEADGISFEEDRYPSISNPYTVIVNDLFKDLDIDVDGILDSNTAEDNDSLDFDVVANSDPSVLQYDLDSGDLRLFTAQDVYGTSTLTLRATDTADPSSNIAFVELDLVVTVTSLNDAPIYQLGAYTNYSIDEDSGDITVDLAGAFSDADLNDNTPGDDQITYRLTIVDAPSEFVLTTLVDESTLNVISDDRPEGADRTLVVETTDATIVLPINADAHGELEITVRATDLGRPPEAPADPLPLADERLFRVTIQGIGDDQPAAVDDHYSDFPNLVIPEDSPTIYFDVGQNDYHGDAPLKVIIVGQNIVDSSGSEQALVSSTRLADPNDTGDFTIQLNGEVSCADQDCLDARRGNTTLSGDGISDIEIAYRPRVNFNGEDSFTYCIEDSEPANEAPFNPPSDPRCATITVNVTPENDKPSVDENIVITMEQADDLVVSEADGLKNFVRDLDNTHLDGLGCDPLLVTCIVAPGDPQPDRLYFYFAGAVTEFGQLFAPFTDDGAFNYRPDATFAGEDSFDFEVCDTPTPGDADHCAAGTVSIQITPIEGAPEGSSDGAVQFDYQLAETPLELPIGPEPNVLIVNDDSGSMAWDISSDGNSGLYQVSSGHSLYYVNKATAGTSTYIAPAEKDAPNQGLWRLRNSDFNTIYYNPAVRYKPWEGLDTNDVEFPDSLVTAARHNPLSSSPTTNLTTTIDFTGRAVVTEERVCTTTCRRYRRGRCISTRTTCTGGTQFTQVQSNGFYIPRYYEWTDLNNNGTMDSAPSPATENPTCKDPGGRVLGCSEGVLKEIRATIDGATALYTKGTKRSDCQTLTNACTYDEEIQNFANWFTYYRSREFTAKAALGVVVANAENLRVGYAKLNNETNILPVESMNTSERTGAKAALLDAIYATNSSGGTPLRRSLRDAGRYFECEANDIFNSGTSTSAGNSRCPVLPAPDGNCQQHFTLLITDGTWNGSSPSTGNSDGDNNTNFDGGAFAGSDFTTLADVAMLYYERDLHTDLENEVPTTARDRALAADDAFENANNELMHQHMTTYTVGFGVSGLVEEDPVNYATGFNWGNPFSSTERKTDDVRHAAYNGRGEYLDASNAGLLADKLVEAFDEFSQGSGAASAVSFNSQEIQEDTLIFRAFYNTKINTGDLIAQSFTDDGLLDEPVWSSAEALDSQPADTRQIITYNDVLGSGVPFRPATLNADQKAVFISDPGASEAQKNAEVTLRVNYLRGDSANERPVGNFRERPALEGRLGDIVHSTPVFIGGPNRTGRDGAPFPQTNLYSSFRNTNADRRDVIYVSSNDGMLHGFDATDGAEVFAYMPNNLMLGTFSRRITELLNFEYTHKFFVDLTPAINDVYMDSDDDGDKEWITFLIGGHGAGAKAYFALNVTDPTKLTEATASDVVLWEFTDADDTYPTDSDGNPLLTATSQQRQDLQDTPQPVKDLGYSFSVPTIAMSNLKDSNNEQIWVSLFGNGFNSTSGIAKLFVLFNDEGVDGTWCHPDMIHNVVLNGTLPAECIGKQDFVKLDTGFGVESGFPNGLGTPRAIDVDGNGTVDFAYAGDTFGNFFRFDLTADDYDDWTVTKIFEASYEDAVGTVTPQPITTQPIVTAHPTEADGFIVIFATGSYITIPDGRNKDVQSIYGLWDRLSPELLDLDDMVQQRFTNLFSAEFGNVRALSNNEVDYSVSGGKKGWYNHLDSVAVNETQGIDDPEFPGEKAIRNIQLRGGLAFVNSIIPRSDTSCVDVAGGFALSFCPGTGGTNCLSNKGIFDLDNDGAFDAGDEVDGQVVAGTRFEDAVPTDSSFIEDKRITQLSDKSLDTTSTNTSGGQNTGRLSWKELDSVE